MVDCYKNINFVMILGGGFSAVLSDLVEVASFFVQSKIQRPGECPFGGVKDAILSGRGVVSRGLR